MRANHAKPFLGQHSDDGREQAIIAGERRATDAGE